MEAPVAVTPVSYRWYEVWQKVILHPSVQSFLDILADPLAKPGRAFLWVAIMGVISGIVQAVASPAIETGLDRSVSLLCGLIGAPIGAVVGLALSAGLLRLFASLFGGNGSFDKMAYSLGSINAPASLVGTIITALALALGAFPAATGYSQNAPLALCVTVPVSLAWAVYLIILQVNAVRAVEKLTTGKALMVVFFPLVLLFILAGICVAIGLVPVLLNTINTMQ